MTDEIMLSDMFTSVPVSGALADGVCTLNCTLSKMACAAGLAELAQFSKLEGPERQGAVAHASLPCPRARRVQIQNRLHLDVV